MARQDDRGAVIIKDIVRDPHLPCEQAVRQFLHRHADEYWSVEDIVTRLNMWREAPFKFDKRAGLRALDSLVREGEASKVGDGAAARYRFVCADDYDPPPGAKQARLNGGLSFEQRIWSAIRVLKYFSLADVAMTAKTERSHTRAYLQRLADAKLIIETGAQRNVWRLNRNRDPGPKAPYLALSLVLVDENTGKLLNVIDSQKAEAWI